VCIAALVPGCKGKDDGTTGSGEGTETGTESETGDGDGDGEETGDADGGSTDETGGDQTVTLLGQVKDFNPLTMNPEIAGAAISVLDLPGFETTSDAEGNYEIAGLPVNADLVIVIEPSTDYWGSIIPMNTGDGPLKEGADLSQVSYELVTEQEMNLQAMNPNVMLDQDASVIVARVLQNSAAADGITVDLTPAPPMDTYYAAVGANCLATLNTNVVDCTFLPMVVFFNVAPDDAGTYTMEATHPTRDCTIPHPAPPTLAGHVTLFNVDCPA
jgi:hypothetical protein